MIKRPKPERFRLRRTMMFMNAQKPGLIKDAYIYGCDSIMLDLEDAVAEKMLDGTLKTGDTAKIEVAAAVMVLAAAALVTMLALRKKKA